MLVAPSAEDAVTVYDAHAGEVALVLTDLVMPGMGGIGLLRALRERASRAPIVMMSGYVGEAASETIAGVSAWVQKPVSARRLGPDHPGGARHRGLSGARPAASWPWEYDGAAMKGYRFAAFWATVLIVLGMLLVIGGVVFAAAAVALDMPWGSLTGQAVLERALAAVVLVISGLLAGAPFIVLGEMMRLFLDLRRDARRQHRLLRRIAPPCRGGVGRTPRRSRPPPTACFRADRKGRRLPRGRLRGSRSARPGGRSMKITDVTLTLFAWANIPATTYGRHTGRFGGESELGLLTLAHRRGRRGPRLPRLGEARRAPGRARR